MYISLSNSRLTEKRCRFLKISKIVFDRFQKSQKIDENVKINFFDMFSVKFNCGAC